MELVDDNGYGTPNAVLCFDLNRIPTIFLSSPLCRVGEEKLQKPQSSHNPGEKQVSGHASHPVQPLRVNYFQRFHPAIKLLLLRPIEFTA